VIGLGGGSVIDVAKAAAALVNETAKSAEYQMGRKIEKTGIPFIACPTTAGTGAEVTYNSVLTNRNRKLSIRDHRMMAKRAIVDPELTYTVPRDVASACGMDGLIHAIEGFCSNSSNIFTDALAEKAIKLFSENLKRAVDGDRDAKDAVSLASTMAGIVLANAGLGAVHGLAASLGGFYNIPHGISCAQLLIPVLRYNLDAIREKLSVMQKIFGREPIGFLDGLMDDLGLKDRFIKPKEEALAEIAKNVSGSVRYNPKNLSHKDFINILKEV
jgi:alcohol dehydrogenase class IV